jgi:hypothetical protein
MVQWMKRGLIREPQRLGGVATEGVGQLVETRISDVLQMVVRLVSQADLAAVYPLTTSPPLGCRICPAM